MVRSRLGSAARTGAPSIVRSIGFARAVDVLIAVGFTVLAQVELRSDPVDGYTAGNVWVNSALALLLTSALVWWRTAPGPAFVWMVATQALPSLFVPHDNYFWTTGLPFGLVVFSTSSTIPGWLGRWSWLLGYAAMVSALLHVPAMRDPAGLVSMGLMFAAVGVSGRLVLRNRQQRDRLDETLRDLAAEQRLREEAAAGRERARIAAELQDVVAHAVGEMVLQVGAARMRLQSDGTPVPRQLAAAERTGREALAELRRSVGVLGEASPSALAPVPGVGAVDQLLDGCREAGLDVRLERTGDLDDLPAGLQLSVYRVLQESLTNVLKHAGPVPVRARLARVDDVVHVEVANSPGTTPGTAAGPGMPVGGHGLVGMRERVGIYGGDLVAGPDGGGWRVIASLYVSAPATVPA